MSAEANTTMQSLSRRRIANAPLSSETLGRLQSMRGPLASSRASLLSQPAPPHRLHIESYRVVDLVIAACSLFFVIAILDSLELDSWRDVASLDVSLPSIVLIAVFLAAWHASFVAVELYDARRLLTWRDEAKRLVPGILPGTAAFFCYLICRSPPRAGDLLGATIAFGGLAYVTTFATRRALRLVTPATASSARKRILIIGNGRRAQRVGTLLSRGPLACDIIGFVDSTRADTAPAVVRRTLGDLASLESILMRTVVDEVIIALPIRSKYSQINKAIVTCGRMGVDVRYLADLYDSADTARLAGAVSLDSVLLKAVSSDYRRYIKRPVEFAIALVALALLTPALLLIAAAIKLQDGGPVFFVQQRHGLHKRTFPMLKFRTMVVGAEAMQSRLETRNEASGAVFKLRKDPRVTRLGSLLRCTSLDELPQLFNVLTGDMSIVGPRPLPKRDVEHFQESWSMRRFSVRPGVTGLWQVSGRSDLTFDELVALDLRYIDEWSLWLDLKILLRTVGAVLRRRGAV